MTMSVDPCEVLERKIRTRVRDDESHRRLVEAVTEVAVAAIHPARHLGLGRSVSRGMLEEPIADRDARRGRDAGDFPLLEDLMETLPTQTLDELANEQRVAEHGLE